MGWGGCDQLVGFARASWAATWAVDWGFDLLCLRLQRVSMICRCVSIDFKDHRQELWWSTARNIGFRRISIDCDDRRSELRRSRSSLRLTFDIFLIDFRLVFDWFSIDIRSNFVRKQMVFMRILMKFGDPSSELWQSRIGYELIFDWLPVDFR